MYDACLQTDPTICHFLVHFPVTHKQISTFQRKKVDSEAEKICMHAGKLLIFNLKESYFENFSIICPILRAEAMNLGNHTGFFDNVENR